MSFALVVAACGSYAAGVVVGGSEVYPKRDRMVDSAMIFTEADLKTIGWKTQKDFSARLSRIDGVQVGIIESDRGGRGFTPWVKMLYARSMFAE